MRRTIFCSMLLFVTIVMVQAAWAQIPEKVSYQGILTDANGVVVDGTVNLTFKLYEAETEGIAVWTETQNGVTVSDGIFNVILGSVGDSGITIPFDRQYWLGVTVGEQPELTPLIQLTASPYSLNARSVADNAVTSVKIAGGQVVKSINSLKDDVILTPGANVTITSSDNTLTISAEGAAGGDGHSLDAADGSPTDAVYVDNDGKVGIGTTDPDDGKLEVNGEISTGRGGLRWKLFSGTPPTHGQISFGHGLDYSQIYSISCVLFDATNGYGIAQEYKRNVPIGGHPTSFDVTFNLSSVWIFVGPDYNDADDTYRCIVWYVE